VYRQAVKGSTIGDLDSSALSEFVTRLRNSRTQLFADRTDNEVLCLLNVLAPCADQRNVPTLAGLLAFGRYPQQFFPQLNITFVSYPGTEPGFEGSFGERFLDNVAIDGNIPTMLKTAIGVLHRNMKHRSIVQGAFRIDSPEYPLESVREAIVNALVHRDYGPSSQGAQVQIEMYPDRLVVRNAGGLYGPIDTNDLGVIPAISARNQALLKILEDAVAEPGRTVCENRGSGISTMRRGLQLGHLPPPIFTDAISTFTVSMANERQVEISSSNTVRGNVLAALSSTPADRNELSKRVKADPQTVSSALVQLRKEGLATLIGAPRSRASKWIKATASEGDKPN
jgi:ATP-dependent DNA helicase RecG